MPAGCPLATGRHPGSQPVERAGAGEQREPVRDAPLLTDRAGGNPADVDHGDLGRPPARRAEERAGGRAAGTDPRPDQVTVPDRILDRADQVGRDRMDVGDRVLDAQDRLGAGTTPGMASRQMEKRLGSSR